MVKTRELVQSGVLPPAKLAELQEQLDDKRDEAILGETLFGSETTEKMTEVQASAMLAAAHRRVERQSAATAARQKLADAGAVARVEVSELQEELARRRQTLELAENQAKLLADLKLMVEAERRAEQMALGTGSRESGIIRYAGNGLFSLADLPTIAGQYERHFHRALPVSAAGQTLLHQSLGLDHRNRVDVALSPGSQEGEWLRALLEKLLIPYLAFRNAIPGAATAPHIHIGPESRRLPAGVGIGGARSGGPGKNRQ